MVTLDSVLASLELDPPHTMLKLDVQGHEAEALAGGQKMVSKLPLIELELALVPLYEGAPELGEMLRSMAALGFDPASFEPNTEDPRTRDVVEVNVVFARRR